MRFRYSTTVSSQNEFDSLPRIPLVLRHNNQVAEVVGLVDSGATVNVLPYDIGIQLGAVWDERQTIIRLAGNLGNQLAIPVFAIAEIGNFTPVRLAFAAVNGDGSISIQMGYRLRVPRPEHTEPSPQEQEEWKKKWRPKLNKSNKHTQTATWKCGQWMNTPVGLKPVIRRIWVDQESRTNCQRQLAI